MFTRKEEKMLHDPYFEVIRETDQFVEIRSVCTGHCWNIFKNTFESRLKVILYHKHKQSDKYYHQHRTCQTVVEAVEQIINHDEYIVQKGKQSGKCCTTDRNLKVYGMRDSKGNPTSTILLKGKWVEESGFNIGDALLIKCDKRKITIIHKEDDAD